MNKSMNESMRVRRKEMSPRGLITVLYFGTWVKLAEDPRRVSLFFLSWWPYILLVLGCADRMCSCLSHVLKVSLRLSGSFELIPALFLFFFLQNFAGPRSFSN